ncbi:phosphoesterase [Mycobacterium antarcticum]|uniref:PA-phosphatase n=1 Tax=Mycolicibacterium sp. TUM20985 TaxID=3023370 RepID=UPI002572D5CD|nr:PA-phosphatase [Mycolicibacterium sp. TUM20985]BDX34543.1 phosphoesterase [Mycolicibacterium sp. TUM20985]
MTTANLLRWWPVIGVLGLLLLGVAVGTDSTALDDRFIEFGHTHPGVDALLYFTDARLVILLFLVTIAAASYRRRWRLAIAAAVTPVVAVVAVRLLKRLFGREMEGALAYPSGHVTVTVVVLGMAVLVVGVSVWAVTIAVAIAAAGLLGQAFTYHYFTDTLGAVLLSTALLCIAVRTANLTRVNPSCDLDHSSG